MDSVKGAEKKILIVLSMHQLLVAMAVMKQQGVCFNSVDGVLVRVGAVNSLLLETLFVNAKIFVVPFIASSSVFARAKEIKRLGNLAVDFLGVKGVKIELWAPNKTYHIVNYILFYSKVSRVIAFEDGLGAYLDSGFLEYRSGLKVATKKLIALILLFPIYRSFGGVSSFSAGEYWALSQRALHENKQVISPAAYISSLRCAYKVLTEGDMTLAPQQYNRSLLVLVGQPLAEVGLCSELASVTIYSQMGSLYFESLGYKCDEVIYLPHPAESSSLAVKRLSAFVSHGPEEISATLVENKLSMELFLYGLRMGDNQVVLVGPLSTSLYTARFAGLVNRAFYFGLGGRGDARLAPIFSDFGVAKLGVGVVEN